MNVCVSTLSQSQGLDVSPVSVYLAMLRTGGDLRAALMYVFDNHADMENRVESWRTQLDTARLIHARRGAARRSSRQAGTDARVPLPRQSTAPYERILHGVLAELFASDPEIMESSQGSYAAASATHAAETDSSEPTGAAGQHDTGTSTEDVSESPLPVITQRILYALARQVNLDPEEVGQNPLFRSIVESEIASSRGYSPQGRASKHSNPESVSLPYAYSAAKRLWVSWGVPHWTNREEGPGSPDADMHMDHRSPSSSLPKTSRPRRLRMPFSSVAALSGSVWGSAATDSSLLLLPPWFGAPDRPTALTGFGKVMAGVAAVQLHIGRRLAVTEVRND